MSMSEWTWILDYEVRVYTQGGRYPEVASIRCSTVEGHLLGIYLYKLGEPLPQDTMTPLYPDDPELAHLRFIMHRAPADQFPWYLDLVRNEWVFAEFNPNYPEAGVTIRTASARAGWGHME